MRSNSEQQEFMSKLQTAVSSAICCLKKKKSYKKYVKHLEGKFYFFFTVYRFFDKEIFMQIQRL